MQTDIKKMTTRTIYTEEMVKNARYNVVNYEWGKKLLKEVTEKAQIYVDKLEVIYHLIPCEGLPRSYKNSTMLVPDDIKCNCPNCGINVDIKYGDWDYDGTYEETWKIICPECQMRFPTNDFELLYQRGLDENRVYHRELAYKRNAEAVARGEKDALVNELYPEKGPTWMVDDGFGWSPESGTYGTKDLAQFAPIAKYHKFLWWGSHKFRERSSLRTILNTLRDAYLYTGDEKYGRAGAIILDRVADVYPDMDIKKVCINYQIGHGTHFSGKAVGNISEYYITETFVRAFDAFRPMFYDEEVIAYLSQKASQFNLENPKSNGELIQRNMEEGILYAIFEGIKNASVHGNFGLHQKVATLIAIAFDRQPITNEIFDWLKAPYKVEYELVHDPIFGLEYQGLCLNTGGGMVSTFVNEIDRDGFGGEISISYNHFWFNGALIASILHKYGKSDWDLYANPKVRKMFDTFARMTVGHGYSLLFGDGGVMGEGKLIPFTDDMIQGYIDVKDPVMAQIFYLYSGGKFDESKLGVFTNIEELKKSILDDIATYGEYKLISENMTGYGLAIARGGEKKEELDTRYDTWMYYGRTVGSHAHLDMLHMGIDAYGFNFGPDFGDPEFKLHSANRHEWIRNTIAHNTVAVGEFGQQPVYTGTPLHYDVTDKVKLIDVECNNAYAQTDIYRRTLVTIAANDEVAYTLDFFRVKGGDKHTYSFHTQSFMGYSTDTLELVKQVDENGEYVGTYAGPDVPYGPDPYSRDDEYAANPKYTRGYTWLKNVNRGTHKAETCEFDVNFKQTNFQKFGPDATALNLNMKFHALNDWKADNVDIVTGYAPRVPLNKNIPGLDYMFIKRTGVNLDTLFTSLLEPYKVESYILKAEQIPVVIKDGKEDANDVVKAVKVTLKSGRVDYVIYATNKTVTYHLTDGAVNFDFKGFVGVYSVDGKGVHSYINDGTLIGEIASIGAYTGTVVDFTKEFVMDNYITIKPDQTIDDLSVLENQYIYVDNKGAKWNGSYEFKEVTQDGEGIVLDKCNGSYRIKKARQEGENIVLDLGNCSLIEAYKDDYDLDAGFVYTIAEGQKFIIPIHTIVEK